MLSVAISFRPHQGINKFNYLVDKVHYMNGNELSFRPHQGINKFNKRNKKMNTRLNTEKFPSPSGDQ